MNTYCLNPYSVRSVNDVGWRHELQRKSEYLTRNPIDEYLLHMLAAINCKENVLPVILPILISMKTYMPIIGEIAQGDPNGILVHRLNQSATITCKECCPSVVGKVALPGGVLKRVFACVDG